MESLSKNFEILLVKHRRNREIKFLGKIQPIMSTTIIENYMVAYNMTIYNLDKYIHGSEV